jgi:electron transfer flavoprotein alpha subunit
LSDIWVVAEADSDGLRTCTLEAIDEGRRLADGLKAHLTVLLLGADTAALAAEVTPYDADTILRIEHPLLAPYHTEAWTAALAELWQEQMPGVVLLSATPNGQDLAPRLAARLRIGYYADCIQVKLTPQGELRFIRPTWQEKVYATATCPVDGSYIATLRPGVISVEKPRSARIPRVTLRTPHLEAGKIRTRTLALIPGDPRSVDLSVAESIVAGGKGVGGPAHWELIEDLAGALDAAVGGSRAAVDQGCIPRARMVGQTGKAVRPKLYLAAGISGVYQHLGAVDAEQIIAINTDRSAPVFARAALGIIADVQTILPALTARLRALRAKSQSARQSEIKRQGSE